VGVAVERLPRFSLAGASGQWGVFCTRLLLLPLHSPQHHVVPVAGVVEGWRCRLAPGEGGVLGGQDRLLHVDYATAHGI